MAVAAAAAAYPDWRAVPPGDRIQFLFRFKQLLEEEFDAIARIVSRENGKTVGEAAGELRRGIENVEVACGIPTMMQGYNLEDIARGIDETMIRQSLGVVGVITPFNFPVMIPLWFLPYAIACGNTVVLKPSEKVPLALCRVIELLGRTGLPKGVVNLAHGGAAAADALLEHPDVQAISFVGSSPVAKYVYAKAAQSGKRVQCQGGAKNHVVVLPDADLETTTKIVSDSAFGCAGQRCLAVATVVTVGEAHTAFRDAIVESAASLRVGAGLEQGVEMGPVITSASRDRIERAIARGTSDGAKAVLDGRGICVEGYSEGYFVGPTVLDGVGSGGYMATTEVFGPVLSLTPVKTLDEAIEVIARNPYGNASSIFTSSGASARRFRSEVTTGNVGVNIGVAAPMAYFPFSGWKQSFFGALHGQGRDAVEFYTDKKVVVERWPRHGRGDSDRYSSGRGPSDVHAGPGTHDASTMVGPVSILCPRSNSVREGRLGLPDSPPFRVPRGWPQAREDASKTAPRELAAKAACSTEEPPSIPRGIRRTRNRRARRCRRRLGRPDFARPPQQRSPSQSACGPSPSRFQSPWHARRA